MQNGFSHLKYRDSEVLGQMRRKSVQSVFAGLLVATVLSCTACGGGDKKEQSAVSVTAKENEVKKKEQVKLPLSYFSFYRFFILPLYLLSDNKKCCFHALTVQNIKILFRKTAWSVIKC